MRKADSQDHRGRSSGIESLMHSGLDQSSMPQLLSREVRQEDMSTHTGGTPVPPLEEEQILELIAEGRHSVGAICRESKMSILELAAHVCTPRNLEALERVRQLHAIQREMMLGTLKRDALTRLGEQTAEVGAMNANEVRACEVMRKACVDILRFGNGPASLPHSTPTPRDDTPEPLNEEKILEALERLGERCDESHDEPYESRGLREPSGPPRCTSGSVELVPWSKAEPQATREGVVGVEATDEVQVGMAFGKTSDHGTGKTSDHGTGKSSDHGTGKSSDHGTESIRTGKMPVPLVEAPSQEPLESRLPIDSRSRNGPGITRGRASGSYLESPPLPDSPPPPAPESSPPPVVEGTLQALRAHHVQMVGWEWEHGGCRAPPLWVRPQGESA